MDFKLYQNDILLNRRELGDVHPVGVLFLTFFLMGIISLFLAVLIEVWCKGGNTQQKEGTVRAINKQNEEEFTQFKNPMYSNVSP